MTATEAPETTRSALGKDPQPADVLVVFGITGDLAKVMTFRSLYRLEQRGLLDCPIVGVAFDDWTLEQLVQRARDSIVGTGEKLDEEVFTRFAKRLSYHHGDFTDDATYARGGGGDRGLEDPRLLPRGPAVPLRNGRRGPGESGRDGKRESRRREALRPRPGLGARTRRRAAPVHRRVPTPAHRPLPREDGPRRDPVPPVREHDARAGLEPELRRIRPDHDGRGLRRRGSRPLLRPGRRAARRRRQPPHAGGRGDRHGASCRGRYQDDPGREGVAVSRDQAGRPGAVRARPVRGIPRHRRRRSGLDHGDVHRAPPGDRQLALVGRPVLHSRGEAAPGHADGGPPRLQAPTAPRLRTARPEAGAQSARHQARSLDGRQDRARRASRRRRHGRADPVRRRVRRDGRRGRDAVRGPAARRAGRRRRTRFTRQDGIEQTWRIMQPLLDAPPPVHVYTPGSWGPEAADKLVAGHGRWSDPWIES